MAAKVKIRFEIDPQTGERTIVVSYQSEPDALPMEHEEEHRELVNKLIEGGVIPAEEGGRVRVERETTQRKKTESQRESEPRQAIEQKG